MLLCFRCLSGKLVGLTIAFAFIQLMVHQYSRNYFGCWTDLCRKLFY